MDHSSILFETNFYDMVIAAVICVSSIVAIYTIKCGILKWQKNNNQVVKEKEDAKYKREREEEAREEGRKKEEEEKNRAKESKVDHDAEKQKKDIQRQERSKTLLKDICIIAKDKEGVVNIEKVEKLFELYQKIYACDNVIEKENENGSEQ